MLFHTKHGPLLILDIFFLSREHNLIILQHIIFFFFTSQYNCIKYQYSFLKLSFLPLSMRVTTTTKKRDLNCIYWVNILLIFIIIFYFSLITPYRLYIYSFLTCTSLLNVYFMDCSYIIFFY